MLNTAPYRSPLFIAELSANHGNSLTRVFKTIDAAVSAGADAIKIQTFKPDTITLKSGKKDFMISGNAWSGQSLYELYDKASLPWEWHKQIFEYCTEKGIFGFSTPFDFTAVDFLEKLDVQCYKIASSELVDIPLIEHIAGMKKKTIISTGMGSKAEISEAVEGFLKHNTLDNLTLLKCTAEYPAKPEDANLLTLRALRKDYGCDVGLSDHSMGHMAVLGAIGLGASIIEKHLTLSRSMGGPDAHFSLEPQEYSEMTNLSRQLLDTFGSESFECTEGELVSKKYRKSLICRASLKIGDTVLPQHIAIVRPAIGIHPRYYRKLLGKKVKRNIQFADPFELKDIE